MQNNNNIFVRSLEFDNPSHIALYPYINFEVFSSVFTSNGYKGEGNHFDFDEISFESDKTTYEILTSDINLVIFTGASKKLDNPIEIGRVTISLLDFMAGPSKFKIPLEDDYNIENIVLSFDCVSDCNNEVEIEFSDLSCYCIAKYEDYTLKLTTTQIENSTPEVVCLVNENRDNLAWVEMPAIQAIYNHENYFNEKIKIEIFTKAGGYTGRNPFGRGSIELLPLLNDIKNYGKITSTARIVFNDGTGKSTEFQFTLKIKNPVMFQQLSDGYCNGSDLCDVTETPPQYVIAVPPKPDVRIIYDNTPEKVVLVDSVYDIYKQRKNFWQEKEDSVGKYYTNIIDNKNYRIRGSSHFFKVTYCGYRPLGLKLSCKTGICVIEDTLPDSIADTLGCFIPRQVVISVNDSETMGLTIEQVTELVKKNYTNLELLIFDPYCIPAYTLLYPEGYSIGSLSNLRQKVDEGFILSGNTYKRDQSQMEATESTETKMYIYRCPECNGYGKLDEKAEEIVCPSCEESFLWKDEYFLSDEEVKKLFGGATASDNKNDNEEEEVKKEEEEEEEEKPVSVEDVKLKEDSDSENEDNRKSEKEETNSIKSEDSGVKVKVEEEKPSSPEGNSGSKVRISEDEKPKEEDDLKIEVKEEKPKVGGKVRVKCPDCQEVLEFDERPEYLDCNCGTSVEVQDSMIV